MEIDHWALGTGLGAFPADAGRWAGTRKKRRAKSKVELENKPLTRTRKERFQSTGGCVWVLG